MSYASRYQKQHVTSSPASFVGSKQQQQQPKKQRKQMQRQHVVAHSMSSPHALGGDSVSLELTSPNGGASAKRQVSHSLPIVDTSKIEMTERLRSMMWAHEQIEALVRHQRKDEQALVSLIQEFLVPESKVKVSSHAELQKALRDRNQALQLLNVVRMEGNAVVHRMHQHMLRQKKQIEALMRENARLQASVGGSADKKINDEALVPAESDGSFVSGQASSNCRLTRTVSSLQAALRREKQQRLEAEELSHKLAVQHQRNVALLEERLQRVGNANITETASTITRTMPVHRNFSSMPQSEPLGDNGDFSPHSTSSSPLFLPSTHNAWASADPFSPSSEGNGQEVLSHALQNGLDVNLISIEDEITPLIVSLTDRSSCGV